MLTAPVPPLWPSQMSYMLTTALHVFLICPKAFSNPLLISLVKLCNNKYKVRPMQVGILNTISKYFIKTRITGLVLKYWSHHVWVYINILFASLQQSTLIQKKHIWLYFIPLSRIKARYCLLSSMYSCMTHPRQLCL